MKHEPHGTRAITLWCRSWQCPDCMPRRLSQLKRLAADGKPTTFLTLTVNPETGQDPTERARELVNAMRIMIKRARRAFKQKTIEYLAVFEETKRGEPHLHMLLRAPFIPQRWISEQMDELIKAPIVDIRKVGSARAVAKYVAKYVAKGPKAFGDLKRYWHTKLYRLNKVDKPPKDADGFGCWRIVQESLYLLAEGFRTSHRRVVWMNDTEIYMPTGLFDEEAKADWHL